MLSIFDFVREMDTAAVAMRLFSAAICGGLIGIEREFKRRPAGFRTHILICLGAAIAMLTNLYLYQVMELYTDISRLGAQVIAGIGFIGAGTIMVTRRQRVKGLTTAAGLWTAAIIGLVCGAGYIECAVFATVMVLVAEMLLAKLEYKLTKKLRDVNLYVEYSHSANIEAITQTLKEGQARVSGLEVTRIPGIGGQPHRYCAVITIHADRNGPSQALINKVAALEDVLAVEEL